MVFEGDLSSFCSENRSPLTDSERANIRLKNLQVNERHQFIPVPVPESDTFTSFIEDQLAKIDNLSECDLNAMVQHTLDTESNSTNTDLQPVQSLTSVSERDLALKKEAKPSLPLETDSECSPDGSETEMGEDFEDENSSPSVQISSNLEVFNSPPEHVGTSTGTPIVNPFALTIPPALAAKVATGLFSLILEPLVSSDPSAPISFAYRAVPVTPAQQQTPSQTRFSQTPTDVSQIPTDVHSGSETKTGKQNQDTGPSKKPRGMGSSHKSGSVKSYSLWMRMGITKDIRIGGMVMKAALEKWNAPRRRVMEWLKEYDTGVYAGLPDYFTQEQLKTMKKLPGGGRPLKDPELEQKLINYYNELKEELYPITSELLTYECLAHNEQFLGGAESPNFKSRVADFLRNWRRRHLKRLRVPTSSGQKLPEGYTGKWEASSYYFYLETKGYDPKWVYHGDETNLPDEDVPSRVYADMGAPRVNVRTSGQEKDNKTGFLVQNTYGEKLPLYPILRGDSQANRPGFHTKKNNSTVRQRFQAKIQEYVESRKKKMWRGLQFWVNDTAYMDEEAFLHWGRTIWKFRAGTSGEEQPPSVLLLDDLRTHKTKRVMDEFKRLYNTKIIILPGGLTPKAQIMDVVNNRPFKVNVRSKQLKLRLKKYKAVKAAQARNPLYKASIGIPTLTRDEHVDIMLQAWAELSPALGAKAWVAVKLMPYELAQQVGWTPKDAFADVRDFDFPWQAVSKIKPAEVDSEDMGAIERDNVSMDFYISKKYVEVFEEFFAPDAQSEEIDKEGTPTCATELPSLQHQLLAIAEKATAHSATESEDSEPLFGQLTQTAPPQTPTAPSATNIPVHTSLHNSASSGGVQTPADPNVLLPSSVFAMSKPRTTTSPKSRKPAPIFKFRLPQPEDMHNPRVCARRTKYYKQMPQVQHTCPCSVPTRPPVLHTML